MQCTQNKIIRFMLNAPWRFHVEANEFKHVGLLPIEYRVEQLMLGHMFNIINGNAPAYLISGINMNQHRYSTRARELSCVIPRVKCSGLTSFLYQGVCHWNNLPLEIKQCPLKTLLNIKLSVFYIVVYLCRKPVYMYVLNFNDRVFFCIFYKMIVISIMCRVIFSEYYCKDHIGNKCTLVCFNVSSLVRLHACSLLVCHVFL